MVKILSLAGLAGVVACANAVEYTVSSCADMASVDGADVTVLNVNTAEFTCDEYTRFAVRSDMTLKSTESKVTFSNFSLKVYGAVTVEPDVVFTGVELASTNGGVIKTDLGSQVTFKGTAEFTDNTVKTVSESYTTKAGDEVEEKSRKGAAIHNKGVMTFEKDATFSGNRNLGLEYGSGPGGAISNHVKGTMHFMGALTMSDNEAQDYFGGAEGGAIYNRGDIVVEGEASFTANRGGQGGVVFNEIWATLKFMSFITFTENYCYDTYGAAIANMGGKVDIMAGSLFDGNFAENSGDGGSGGGVFNFDGGVVTLMGDTTFNNNYGYYGGAIFNMVGEEETNRQFINAPRRSSFVAPTITYPEDTVFTNQRGEYCNDIAYAYDKETCGL